MATLVLTLNRSFITREPVLLTRCLSTFNNVTSVQQKKNGQPCAPFLKSNVPFHNAHRCYNSAQARMPTNTIIMFVPQQEAWIIERMGKYLKILEPVSFFNAIYCISYSYFFPPCLILFAMMMLCYICSYIFYYF